MIVNMRSWKAAMWLLVLPLLTQGAGTSHRELYVGTAHFLRAGEVASPVAFRTIGVEILIPKYDEHHNNMVVQVKEYLERLRHDISVKFGKDEAEVVIERVKRRIMPQLHRMEHATQDLLQFYGTAVQSERSAVLLGLAAAVGSVVAMGSALLSQHQIQRVSNEVRYLRGHARKLDSRLENLKGNFRKMGKTVYEFHLEEEVVSNITMMLEPYILDARSTLGGLYALKDHRLHPGLLGPQVMEEVQAELEEIRGGWHAVFDVSSELLSIPVSYVQGARKLLVMLHVPVVQDSRTMMRQLYRLDAAVMERDNRLVRLTTSTPYIGVDSKWNTHQVMSKEDLEACTRVGKTYLCSDDNILLSRPSTCTAALFFGLSEMAATRCEAKLVEEDVPAIRLNDTVYAFSPGTITSSCPGDEPKVMTLGRVTRVKINRACSVKGDGFTIAARPEHVEPKIVDHQVLIPEVIVTDPAKKAADLLKPDLSLDLFLETSNDDDNDDIDDDSIWADPSENWEWVTIILIITCVFVVLSIVAATWCLWKKCRARPVQQQERDVEEALEMRDIKACGDGPAGGPDDHVAVVDAPVVEVEAAADPAAAADAAGPATAAPRASQQGPRRAGRGRHGNRNIRRGAGPRPGPHHQARGGAQRRRGSGTGRGAGGRRIRQQGLVRMVCVEPEVSEVASGSEDEEECTLAAGEVVEDASSTERKRVSFKEEE